MGETGEIKLNIKEVESDIEKLKSCKTNLLTSYDEIVTGHSSLKENWKGKSGTTFTTCSESIEKNLKGRIDGLQKLIDMLEESKVLLVDTDTNLFAS